jgi:hypothetical protein
LIYKGLSGICSYAFLFKVIRKYKYRVVFAFFSPAVSHVKTCHFSHVLPTLAGLFLLLVLLMDPPSLPALPLMGAFMVSSYCALTKREDLQCLSHDLPHRFHVLPSLPCRSRSLVCESIPAPLMRYIPLVLDGLTPIFQPFGNMLSAHLMILFFWHFSA